MRPNRVSASETIVSSRRLPTLLQVSLTLGLVGGLASGCKSSPEAVSPDAGEGITPVSDAGSSDGGVGPEERDSGMNPITPGPAMGEVGGPCMSDADCGAQGSCIQETGFVEGYCFVLDCNDAQPCPDDNLCYRFGEGEDSFTACIDACVDDGDCRPGYVCDADQTCWPGCDDSRPCPAEFTCSGGQCVEPALGPDCSPENPGGLCPDGQFCIEGSCQVPPDCDEDAHEPNDDRASASVLSSTDGTSVLGGRCAGDQDWYRVDVPEGKIVTVTAHLPAPTASNLDVYAYDGSGTALGARVYGASVMPSWARAYETREESFGFYSPSGTTTYYLQVVGQSPSMTGAYTLSVSTVDWRDGETCTGEGFTSRECLSGARGAQTLISFPFPHPGDAYNGYVFDSVSNYRFLRRETMMAVRHAIGAVSERFPGTSDIGLIDMCQRDGITPGYDVSDPRHPESTHDQGGNIDIAYYQTGGNNRARTVCDGSETSHDGYFCNAGATETHIVDLRRQVYFIVQLAKSGRLRVVGVDRVIGPLLAAEAEAMVDEGIITAAEERDFTSYTTWGDGWPFHHHHIHVSMQWI